MTLKRCRRRQQLKPKVRRFDPRQTDKRSVELRVKEALWSKNGALAERLLRQYFDEKVIRSAVKTVTDIGYWKFLFRLFRNSKAHHFEFEQSVMHSFFSRHIPMSNVIILNCMKDVFTEEQKKTYFFELFRQCDHKQSINDAFFVFLSTMHSGSVNVDFMKEIIVRVYERGSLYSQARLASHVSGHQDLWQLYQAVSRDILLETLTDDEQNLILTSLVEDGREGCSYFAVLFAAEMNRYDIVRDLVMKRKVVMQAGALEVITGAWREEAVDVECICTLVQNFIKAPNQNLSQMKLIADFFSRRFSRVRYMGANYEIYDEFICTCRQFKLYGACALFALWAGDLKPLRKIILKEQDKRAVAMVLGELAGCDLPRLALDLMNRKHCQNQALCVNAILNQTAQFCFSSNRSAKATTLQLMTRCRDKSVLTTVLFHIVRLLHSDLFHQFVARDLINIGRFRHGKETLLTLLLKHVHKIALKVPGVTSMQDLINSGRKEIPHLQAILLECLEAGVGTHQTVLVASLGKVVKSPMQLAVDIGFLDLVRVLYGTGATYSAELYKLSTDLERRTRLERFQRYDLLQYLDKVASTPRSLGDLCRLTVSHFLGCRADRKTRALSLQLSMQVTREVLLQDVLYEDNRSI